MQIGKIIIDCGGYGRVDGLTDEQRRAREIEIEIDASERIGPPTGAISLKGNYTGQGGG